MGRDHHPLSEKSINEKANKRIDNHRHEEEMTEKVFGTPQEPNVYHGDPQELSPIAAELTKKIEGKNDRQTLRDRK